MDRAEKQANLSENFLSIHSLFLIFLFERKEKRGCETAFLNKRAKIISFQKGLKPSAYFTIKSTPITPTMSTFL